MDLLRYSTRSIVVARILSAELWCVPSHWSPGTRRTLLCPADARCPRCALERPKIRGYAIAKAKHGPDTVAGLIELGPEVCEQLHHRGLDDSDAAGWSWRMEKRAERPGWKVLAAEQMPIAEPYAPEALASALETLYGLPLGIGADGAPFYATTQREWQLHHAPVLYRRVEADVAHDRSQP